MFNAVRLRLLQMLAMPLSRKFPEKIWYKAKVWIQTGTPPSGKNRTKTDFFPDGFPYYQGALYSGPMGSTDAQ